MGKQVFTDESFDKEAMKYSLEHTLFEFLLYVKDELRDFGLITVAVYSKEYENVIILATSYKVIEGDIYASVSGAKLLSSESLDSYLEHLPYDKEETKKLFLEDRTVCFVEVEGGVSTISKPNNQN